MLPGRSLFALARPDFSPDGQPPADLRRPGPEDAAEVIEVIGRAHAQRQGLRPGDLRRGHRPPLADPSRPVRRARQVRLPGRGRLPRLRLAERPRRDRGRAAGRGLGRHHPDAVGRGRVHSSVAETVLAHGRAVRSVLVAAARAGRGHGRARESWMLRLLDAPAAIAARGFPAADLAVPLRITDDLLPGQLGPLGADRPGRHGPLLIPNGAVLLPPPLRVRRADAAGAERRGLAALYAGTPVATLRRAGLAGGGRPDGRRRPGRRVRRDPVHARFF